MLGYTVVEVMIVLAITSVLFASSVTVFQNRRQSTEFSQAMYDLQSKIQSYSNQVSSAALPDDGQSYVCTSVPVGSYPSLAPSALPQGDITSQDCIFLGKTLQIIPATDTIYVYPVFGSRVTSTGDSPANALAASPEPAIGPTPARTTFYEVESYQLLNGTKILSAKSGGGERDILAIYLNLAATANVSGNNVVAYTSKNTYTSKAADIKNTNIRTCIEGGAPCGGGTVVGNTNLWTLCVQNDAGTKKANLDIQAIATGISTKLTMDSACT
jgi:type II secretory pathway pseudopilin PulG